MRVALLSFVLCFCVLECPREGEASPTLLGFGVRLLTRVKYRIDAALRKRKEDVPALIRKNGYPVETHKVTTEDGYILRLHRIPHGKRSPKKEGERRPAVLVQHGILSSSADWVLAIPEKALGFVLADAGYDVWMGNYRGNTYSRDHVRLNPNSLFDSKFWIYSWDECGIYDIPAMIDLILKKTGHEQIHYLGHSMGTTGFMVMMNSKPEYGKKVIMANFLAPVAYMENTVSPIRAITPFIHDIMKLVDTFGFHEFITNNFIVRTISRLTCNPNDIIQEFCSNFIFVLAGFDRDQMNYTMLPILSEHTPAGSNAMMLAHYGQQVRSGKFHRFDFGTKENLRRYGQSYPPEWHPENVTVPLALYWGPNDWFTADKDYERLLGKLPNIVDNYSIPLRHYSHIDFMYAVDNDKLLFPRLLQNMAAAEEKYQMERNLIR